MKNVIKKQYKKHQESLKKNTSFNNPKRKGNKALLTKYAGTSLAEFFAVSTELFFEKGKQLNKSEPELYELLKDFYKLDPVSWMDNN